jgi:hypothetical protein
VPSTLPTTRVIVYLLALQLVVVCAHSTALAQVCPGCEVSQQTITRQRETLCHHSDTGRASEERILTMNDSYEKLNREQLYTLIWSKPATKLAAELGITYSVLKNLCQ